MSTSFGSMIFLLSLLAAAAAAAAEAVVVVVAVCGLEGGLGGGQVTEELVVEGIVVVDVVVSLEGCHVVFCCSSFLTR